MACSVPTGYSITSAPRRLIAPASASGSGSAASVSVTPSRWASGSKVAPWSSVETTTAKNTMLKNSTLFGTPSITGNVAKTTGSAPRSPAQPSTTCSRNE